MGAAKVAVTTFLQCSPSSTQQFNNNLPFTFCIRSRDNLKSRFPTLRKSSCIASLNSFSDGKFSKRFQEFVAVSESEIFHKRSDFSSRSFRCRPFESTDPPWMESDEIVLRASIERKANSVDLPFSLRILKRKRQWQDGFEKAGESAFSSVQKAFSSMVFIIREIQTYTFHMRESRFLNRVHREMQSSFVWIFQQVFSHTPMLMLSVMTLLANFTVYSVANTIPIPVMTETVSELKLEPESVQPELVQGTGGSGGKVVRRVAGPMDGGEAVESEEEVRLWKSVVEEASRMQAELRDESLDRETVSRFVSPVTVRIEPEDYSVYDRTELLYQRAVSEEPDNALVLCNYAQFLYLVLRNNDRAEEYFKRAVRVDPPDAESLSQYASFLWLARKDLGAAEETFLRAIDADRHNTFYASNYAHFLWNTGSDEDDTCFLLTS